MAANWNKPTLDSLYTDFRDELVDRADDHAKMFNGTGTTNLPIGVIGWDGSTNKFNLKTITGWSDLSSEYQINVNKLDNLTGSEYVNVASTQTISGVKTFSSNVTVEGTTTLKGNTVLGDSVLDNITVTGKFQSTTFEGDVVLEGATTDLTVGGNAVVTGTLNVSGLTSFGSSLATSGSLSVLGNTTLGNASSDTITLTGTVGATTFDGDVTLSGTTTDLDVGGAITEIGRAHV